MAKKPPKSQSLARLYTMNDEALKRIEEQVIDTGLSRSEIVRRSVLAFDVRTPEQLRARAEQLQAIAEKKDTAAPAASA